MSEQPEIVVPESEIEDEVSDLDPETVEGEDVTEDDGEGEHDHSQGDDPDDDDEEAIGDE